VKKITRIMKSLVIARRGATKQSILWACPGGSTSFHRRVGRSAARCRSASSRRWFRQALRYAQGRSTTVVAVACFATAPCPHAASSQAGLVVAAQDILRVFLHIQELLVLLSEKKSFEKLEQSKNSDKNTFKLNFCRKIIE
jgi:hypothetical protein